MIDYLKDNNIWIVIQGPMANFEQVQSYYCDIPNVVWSGWSQDVDKIKHQPNVVLSKLPIIKGYKNVYCQAKTTMKGIKKAKDNGAKFIFKIRSDMVFSDICLLVAKLKLDGTIFFGAYHNWDGGYLTDFFMFGPVDKLLKIWDIPIKFRWRKVPPERLMTNNFLKYFPTDKINYISPILFENNIKCYWFKYNKYVDETFKNDPLFSFEKYI